MFVSLLTCVLLLIRGFSLPWELFTIVFWLARELLFASVFFTSMLFTGTLFTNVIFASVLFAYALFTSV